MFWIALLSCAERPDPEGVWVVRGEEIMSTWVQVNLPEEQAEEAERVFEVFRRVEVVANEWRAGSPLATVNAGAGGPPVPVPPELAALLARGLELGDLTGGAFDVTWAALWGLWDFNATPPVLPDPGILRARLAHVGHRQVRLEGGAVSMPAGTVIGLGGIAKGWALDRAAEALEDAGVAAFSLSAGGQITTRGLRDGRPWRVGIRDPRGAAADWFALVETENGSVSTSGDYERYFVVDGVRYHHVIDPRTGWPARGARSATVVAADSTLADALSTALMVLGPVEGLGLAERIGVSALVVDEAGEAHVSQGMQVRMLARPRR